MYILHFLRKFLITVPIVLVLFSFSKEVVAQNRVLNSFVDPVEVGKPYFRVFSDKDGLPQNSVQEVIVDKKNYLWIATQDGAAYYNGHRWTTVNMPNQKASNYIRALYASSDGSIWFGTYAGVWRLKDKNWTEFNTSNSGLSNNIIHTFWETEEKGKNFFWVGTNNGLSCLDLAANKWVIYSTKDGLPDNRARVLWGTRTNVGYKLWLGTDSGFGFFQNGKWTTVNIDILGEKGATLPVRCFLDTEINGKRAFYVGTDGEGLLSLTEQNTWVAYKGKDFLPNDHVFDLLKTSCIDGTERLWVATYGGGIVCLENSKWIVYDTKTGLPNNVTSCLFETKIGNGSHQLWVGTNGGGIYRLEDDQWLTYDTKLGLSDNTIMSLLETKLNGSNAIWFGTYGGGLTRLENGQWTVFNTKNGLPDNSILSLLETFDENKQPVLWVATEGNGLAQLKAGKWTTFNKDSGLSSNSVRVLLETKEKNGTSVLWIGTTGGVTKLENGKWTSFDTTNGLSEDVVTAMASTLSNNGDTIIWCGTTGGGLAYYHEGKWSALKMADGLPSDTIYSLFATKEESTQCLWVGTTGGVCRLKFNGDKIEWLFASDITVPALPNNIINQIKEDAKGRIYLFTNKGVAQLTPKKKRTENISDYDAYTFTTENGLPSNEFNVGASMIDHRGRIWAGTVAGATVFDPAKDNEDRSAKIFYVERMLVNGKEHPFDNSDMRLNYDQNTLSFEYALLSYFRESDTRYQTQLVGLDKSPSDWVADYKKEYTTLPYGNYIFRIWAKDYHGNISGPLDINFYIKTPPWQSWWAYVCYIISLSTLVYLVLQLRLKSLRQRNQMLTTLYQKEQEVTRTLHSLNKMKTDFMLVTSHEMRTPLTVLKGYLDSLVELNLANLTVSQQRIIKTCHRVTDRLIAEVNDIQEMLKIEERRIILKAETIVIKFLMAEIIEEVDNFIKLRHQTLELVIPEDLPALIADCEKIRIVLLNLIQNAIKFTPDDGKILVKVEKRFERIVIQVQDTGIGIDVVELERIFEKFYTGANPLNHTSGKYGFEARGTGLGLAVARGYVEAHGGQIWAESEGAGKGSTFHLWFPINNVCPLPESHKANVLTENDRARK